MTTKLEKIEEFSKHYCLVCKKKIMVMCGTPVVHIGGCCVGIEDEENKMVYIRRLKAHFHCYLENKPKTLMLKYKDIKASVS